LIGERNAKSSIFEQSLKLVISRTPSILVKVFEYRKAFQELGFMSIRMPPRLHPFLDTSNEVYSYSPFAAYGKAK